MQAARWVYVVEWLFRVFLVVTLVIAVVEFFALGGEAPTYDTPEAQSLGDALHATGYIFPLLVAGEGLVALMMLVDRLVPVGVLLALPIAGNVLLFNALLDDNPGGLVAGVMMLVAIAFIVWSRRATFARLLAPARAGTPAGTG